MQSQQAVRVRVKRWIRSDDICRRKFLLFFVIPTKILNVPYFLQNDGICVPYFFAPNTRKIIPPSMDDYIHTRGDHL